MAGFVLQYCLWSFTISAFKHGCEKSAIRHALDHALVKVLLEPDSDPPKMLAIGPDQQANLLEIIWVELPDGDLIFHAMGLRPVFFELLPTPRGDEEP